MRKGILCSDLRPDIHDCYLGAVSKIYLYFVKYHGKAIEVMFWQNIISFSTETCLLHQHFHKQANSEMNKVCSGRLLGRRFIHYCCTRHASCQHASTGFCKDFL